jgi:hypothetical protein
VNNFFKSSLASWRIRQRFKDVSVLFMPQTAGDMREGTWLENTELNWSRA